MTASSTRTHRTGSDSTRIQIRPSGKCDSNPYFQNSISKSPSSEQSQIVQESSHIISPGELCTGLRGCLLIVRIKPVPTYPAGAEEQNPRGGEREGVLSYFRGLQMCTWICDCSSQSHVVDGTIRVTDMIIGELIRIKYGTESYVYGCALCDSQRVH